MLNYLKTLFLLHFDWISKDQPWSYIFILLKISSNFLPNSTSFGRCFPLKGVCFDAQVSIYWNVNDFTLLLNLLRSSPNLSKISYLFFVLESCIGKCGNKADWLELLGLNTQTLFLLISCHVWNSLWFAKGLFQLWHQGLLQIYLIFNIYVVKYTYCEYENRMRKTFSLWLFLMVRRTNWIFFSYTVTYHNKPILINVF